MKKKNDKLIYRIKNPYKTRPKFKSVTKKENESEIKNNSINKSEKKNKTDNPKVYLPEVPDVGRYNPTYNVLDRHSYQVAFCPRARIIHEWQRISKRKLISRMNWEHIKGLCYMFRKHNYFFSTKKLKASFYK